MAGKVALVTGATRGIGLETVRQLAGQGFHVLLGARKLADGEARAAALRAEGLNVDPIQLDVCDGATHAAAAKLIGERFGRLDVLVNNAGIYFSEGDTMPGTADLAIVRTVFDTNFFGPLAVTQALLPLLRQAERGRIVFVSSGVGSLANNAAAEGESIAYETIGYNASKASINMLVIQLAHELRDTNIKVNAVCPGFVQTDMNGGYGDLSVAEGAGPSVRYALLDADGPSGGFFNTAGPIPW